MYYTYCVNKLDSSLIMLNQVKKIASEIGDYGLYVRTTRGIAEAFSYINVDSAIFYYNFLLDIKHEYSYSEIMYMEVLAKLYHQNG